MRIPTLGLAACLLALVVLVPVSSAGSGSYIGGTGDVAATCILPNTVGSCIGGHTFVVPDGTQEATIVIDDAVTDPTGGFFRFYTEDGATLSQATFCDTAHVPVPEGADRLGVAVREVFGPSNCGQTFSFGTVGEVHVVWS